MARPRHRWSIPVRSRRPSLLGPTATRFLKTKLEWNSAKLKFRNSPEATQDVRKTYRRGWSVKGL
jgi:hypothetical protein